MEANRCAAKVETGEAQPSAAVAMVMAAEEGAAVEAVAATSAVPPPIWNTVRRRAWASIRIA